MSTKNPYLTGNEDADLFEDNSAQTNEKVVGFINSDGKQIPEELAETLRKYVGEDIVLGTSTIPPVVMAMSEMQSFFSHILHSNEDSPLLLALYQVVNQMSEGILDKYVHYYQIRQEIILIHTIKFYSNIVIQLTESSKTDEEYSKVLFYLTNYHDYLDWKFERIKNLYLIECKNLGIEIDYSLLEKGEFSDEISKRFYKASYTSKIIKEKLFPEISNEDNNEQSTSEFSNSEN